MTRLPRKAYVHLVGDELAENRLISCTTGGRDGLTALLHRTSQQLAQAV
jgi:hypothetical protein